jgi:Ser/Thr protein kinase RdoA (MazF antagonist)
MSRTAEPPVPTPTGPAETLPQRPAVSVVTAESLARDLFDFSGLATELASERGRNFRITAPQGERRVLKVTWDEPSRAFVELETRVLGRAAAAGLPVPRLWPSRRGRLLEDMVDELGRRGVARLIDHLDGRHLAEVPKSAPVLGALGAALGRLDALLQDEDDPAADRVFDWDLARTPEITGQRIGAIGDPAQRELLARLMERSDREITNREPALRRGVVHNDANDYNVLVAPADGSALERFEPSRITGLLDFGDLVRTFLVCEPAVAAAYAALDQRDPLAAVCAVAAGYHRELPLEEAEIDVFFAFVLRRLCLSATMSAHQRAREPDNEYLSVSEAAVWRALERFERIHPRFAAWSLRRACGLEPVPGRRRVVAALAASRPAPVLGRALDAASTLVVDFGVATPLLAELEDRDDQREWSRVVDRELARAGASVGWGRYDEARGWYTTSAFQSADSGEARTVHLGVDLFVPPGTPVHAPLAGRVHSTADNDRPLDYGATLVLEHELAARAATEGGEGGATEPVRCYTLWGHLTRDTLARHRPGDPIAAGQEIARVGDLHENGGWAPHLHLQVILDLLDREGDFPGVAAPSQRALWLANSPDPNLLLRLPDAVLGEEPGGDLASPSARDALRHRRANALGPSLSLSHREPLWIVRGEGASPFDHEGRRYVDLVNNVCHVGHANPRVVRAMATQAALLETNTRYLHETVLRYAERLRATLPPPLEVCFFVNSGSEANDLALRLAREHTGRRDVVCLEAAYHGNLTSLIEVSPYKHDGPGGSGTPSHVHKAWLPDPYRGRCRGMEESTAAESYAESVARACAAARAGGGVAAFLSETILSCGGQIVPPSGYLARAYAAVRVAGGVVHRRRGADRLRSRRYAFLGVRDAGRGARHRHPGQTHRQRASARRRGHHARHRRVVRARRHGVLQHLRRQPGVGGGRSRGARRDRRGGTTTTRARARGAATRGAARPAAQLSAGRRRRARPWPLPGHRAGARPRYP